MNDYDAEHVEYLKAERDRLRAELADQAETLRVTDDSLFRAVEDAQRAEAAIARVRELCDYSKDSYWSARIERALDGGTE